MQFGITIKPDMPVERIVALTRQAEASGFEYGWIFDSHVLWLEPYPMLTLMATNTKKMRLGTCVTNPATRDIPVIGLSSHAMIGDREIALSAGCDDYDTKPIELERLLAKMRHLLARGGTP